MLGSRAEGELLTRAFVGIVTVKFETLPQPASKYSDSLQQLVDGSHRLHLSLGRA
jgi:hypothetical protein